MKYKILIIYIIGSCRITLRLKLILMYYKAAALQSPSDVTAHIFTLKI